MRIDRLIMTGFGRFQGRTLELGPGLNLLYGPNEAGKTTVQKFMLGMLYGFKKRGQRRDYAEESARYRPWAGGEYRGALEYTLELTGRRCRVEREFEPGRDEVRLYDALTGADLSGQHTLDRRKELLFAEEQLHLPEEAFRSTAWVGQLGVSRLEMGRELVARVANLQESGREDLSVQAALRFLEERGKEIGTERAGTKPYGRVCRAIEEGRAELERARGAREQTLDWEARLAEVRGALAEMDEELDDLSRRLDWVLAGEAEQRLARAAEAGRRAADLREQEVRAAAALAAVDQELAGGAAAGARGAGLAPERGAGSGRRTEAQPAGGGPRGRGPGPWPGAGAGALLLAGAAAAYTLGAGPVAAALAGVLAVICLALFARERGRAAQAAADAARARTVRHEQLSARQEGLRERLEQLRGELATLRSLLGGANEEALAAEAGALRARLRGAPPGAGARSAAELREAIRRLEARRAERRAMASDLGARVETVLADLPDTADLRLALAALEEEKAGYDAELSALHLARETIDAVAAEMHREFAPKLNEAMGSIVAELTGGRYSTVRIDEEMGVRALAEGERTVELAALSGGTVDQFYLALRLALLDLVTEGQEPVPLILDDPFVQYDDARAGSAMAWLGAAAARGRQVILMTCHRRDAGLAEGLGARLIELEEAAREAT